MISAADARLIVEELETGRGRLVQIADRYPELRVASQERLAELCGGDVLPLFRHIQLRQDVPAEVRDEGIVSLTANPVYVLKLARDAPGLVMTPKEWIRLSPLVRRYDVPVERVLLYIPTVAQDLMRDRSAALGRMKIRTRRGGSMTGTEIVQEVLRRKEHEVVANVSGLDPMEIELPRTEDIYLALAWIRGRIRSGSDAIRLAESEGRIFVTERDGKFVKTSEQEEARVNALFEFLEEFFSAPCVGRRRETEDE